MAFRGQFARARRHKAKKMQVPLPRRQRAAGVPRPQAPKRGYQILVALCPSVRGAEGNPPRQKTAEWSRAERPYRPRAGEKCTPALGKGRWLLVRSPVYSEVAPPM